MKKPAILALLLLALAIPVSAIDRHQSFISYDDGGTTLRSGDGNEIEVHRNLPVYPEDELITDRRGRAEVRLSDGNIIGLDRATAVRFQSILDSYEGSAEETVVELRHGKVAVYRTDIGRDLVRLDTMRASYVAEYEAIYSVETDENGRDRVTVFEGAVEVRTPKRATRLRRGETGMVDRDGLYDLVSNYGSDDFERWFVDRSERFDSRSNRYVDRRLSYWTDDLDGHGQWVLVSGMGWAWRPYVAVGWRPYHNGYWHRSRFGCLTWVSYDPWGWGTYHYGRWSYDPGFGWVWVPGYGYSPAWVYWMYGPSYVGWAPAGWWDCYRPYYDWAYRPYRHYGPNINLGFWGRIRVSEVDLRPWTFVDPAGLVSTRVDRAALTTDAIKHRLGRSGGGIATVSGGATRLTNEDLRDPAEAIRRRALDGREGRLTGRETGEPPTDFTPFFRRDEKLAGDVRDRISRVRGGGATQATPAAPSRTGGLDRIGGGIAAPSAPAAAGPAAGAVDRRGTRDAAGAIRRGGGAASGSTTGTPRGSTGTSGSDTTGTPSRGGTPAPAEPATGGRTRAIGRERTPDAPARDANGTSWRRDRQEPATGSPSPTPGVIVLPDNGTTAVGSDWRSGAAGSGASSPSGTTVDRRDSSSRSDVPRRVIDRIGGARVYPRDPSPTPSTRGSGSSRSSEPSSGSVRAPRSSSGSSGRTRSVGSGSSTPRPSSGSSSGSARSSSGSSGSSSSASSGSSPSGGGRSEGGRIRRD